MAQHASRASDSVEKGIVGIVGDRNAQYPLHVATEKALLDGRYAPSIEWIPTEQVGTPKGINLSRYAGFLIAPGSPYRSMDGALAVIQYARENRVPLLATCGGFQHLVVELARNVCGLPDADHEETRPGAPRLAVTALRCSLAGQIHPVRLLPATKAAAIYAVEQVSEPFFCNYGLNPEFRPLLESHGLAVGGVGKDGEVRIIELSTHPFFLGTLYVPQARHTPSEPHPLIGAFVAAARQEQDNARRLHA